MAYNFSSFKAKAGDAEKWLAHELSSIRSGMASPALLDGIEVESYGARTPLFHVANIGIEDARTLKVTPWDKLQIKDIEKAIAAANLGISTSPSSDGVRVIFPALTEERRKFFIKVVKEKMEEARVAVRVEREKVWTDIQDKERKGEIPEDDKFRGKDELQKMVDEVNKKLEDIAGRKEKEIIGG